MLLKRMRLGTLTRVETGPAAGWQNPAILRVIGFALLYGLWVLLSGKFILEYLVAGAVASAGVAAMTAHLLHPSSAEHYQPLPRNSKWLAARTLRFLAFLPWLVMEIAIANLQVTYQILHPALPVAPRLLRFRTALRFEPSQILLAHSITLTPGTITVDLSQGEFLVHALSSSQMQALAEGRMQQRIARVFGESNLQQLPTSDSAVELLEADQ